MPDYPYSDNMYSGLEDSDVEEQPLEYTYQTNSGPTEVERSTQEHGHEYGVGTVGDAYHQDHQDHHYEEDVLSPTDGYFGRSGSGQPSPASRAGAIYPSDPYSSSSRNQEGQVHAASTSASAGPSTSGYTAATSAQVPRVPDVWVSDPSIAQESTAESKAREAREERELLNSRRRAAGQLDVPNPSALTFPSSHQVGRGGYPPTPSHPDSQSQSSSSSSTSTSGSSGSHPRYAFGPGLSSVLQYVPPTHSPQRYTPPFPTALSRPQRSGTVYSERSSLFSEAPPAYTPSPTTSSPTTVSSVYQTFSPSSPFNMGRPSESESQGLLAGQHNQYRSPQDMGGERTEGDYYSTFTPTGDWRDRARGCVPHFTGRTCKFVVLGLVLVFVTVGFIASSFVGVEDKVVSFCLLAMTTTLINHVTHNTYPVRSSSDRCSLGLHGPSWGCLACGVISYTCHIVTRPELLLYFYISIPSLAHTLTSPFTLPTHLHAHIPTPL